MATTGSQELAESGLDLNQLKTSAIEFNPSNRSPTRILFNVVLVVSVPIAIIGYVFLLFGVLLSIPTTLDVRDLTIEGTTTISSLTVNDIDSDSLTISADLSATDATIAGGITADTASIATPTFTTLSASSAGLQDVTTAQVTSQSLKTTDTTVTGALTVESSGEIAVDAVTFSSITSSTSSLDIEGQTATNGDGGDLIFQGGALDVSAASITIGSADSTMTVFGAVSFDEEPALTCPDQDEGISFLGDKVTFTPADRDLTIAVDDTAELVFDASSVDISSNRLDFSGTISVTDMVITESLTLASTLEVTQHTLGSGQEMLIGWSDTGTSEQSINTLSISGQDSSVPGSLHAMGSSLGSDYAGIKLDFEGASIRGDAVAVTATETTLGDLNLSGSLAAGATTVDGNITASTLATGADVVGAYDMLIQAANNDVTVSASDITILNTDFIISTGDATINATTITLTDASSFQLGDATKTDELSIDGLDVTATAIALHSNEVTVNGTLSVEAVSVLLDTDARVIGPRETEESVYDPLNIPDPTTLQISGPDFVDDDFTSGRGGSITFSSVDGSSNPAGTFSLVGGEDLNTGGGDHGSVHIGSADGDALTLSDSPAVTFSTPVFVDTLTLTGALTCPASGDPAIPLATLTTDSTDFDTVAAQGSMTIGRGVSFPASPAGTLGRKAATATPGSSTTVQGQVSNATGGKGGSIEIAADDVVLEASSLTFIADEINLGDTDATTSFDGAVQLDATTVTLGSDQLLLRGSSSSTPFLLAPTDAAASDDTVPFALLGDNLVLNSSSQLHFFADHMFGDFSDYSLDSSAIAFHAADITLGAAASQVHLAGDINVESLTFSGDSLVLSKDSSDCQITRQSATSSDTAGLTLIAAGTPTQAGTLLLKPGNSTSTGTNGMLKLNAGSSGDVTAATVALAGDLVVNTKVNTTAIQFNAGANVTITSNMNLGTTGVIATATSFTADSIEADTLVLHNAAGDSLLTADASTLTFAGDGVIDLNDSSVDDSRRLSISIGSSSRDILFGNSTVNSNVLIQGDATFDLLDLSDATNITWGSDTALSVESYVSSITFINSFQLQSSYGGNIALYTASSVVDIDQVILDGGAGVNITGPLSISEQLEVSSLTAPKFVCDADVYGVSDFVMGDLDEDDAMLNEIAFQDVKTSGTGLGIQITAQNATQIAGDMVIRGGKSSDGTGATVRVSGTNSGSVSSSTITFTTGTSTDNPGEISLVGTEVMFSSDEPTDLQGDMIFQKLVFDSDFSDTTPCLTTDDNQLHLTTEDSDVFLNGESRDITVTPGLTSDTVYGNVTLDTRVLTTAADYSYTAANEYHVPSIQVTTTRMGLSSLDGEADTGLLGLSVRATPPTAEVAAADTLCTTGDMFTVEESNVLTVYMCVQFTTGSGERVGYVALGNNGAP